MPPSIQEKIDRLRELIRTYDAAYYGKGVSLIPDKEYDELYRQLTTLETAHPEFADNDSPTRRIGNDLAGEFKKVAHSVRMMSIENTYSEEEITQWIDRTGKNAEAGEIEFIGELKVDGVACAVRYDKGKLVQAITRGDGTTGDDVTANVRTIKSLPLQLDYQEPFEIRGEIFMTFDRFNALNEALVENGLEPMQNPRNTTAGTIKLLDPNEVAKRRISFNVHYLLSKAHARSHCENLTFLSDLGFPTVIHSPVLNSAEQVIRFCNEWELKKNSLPFPVDGVVLKVNSLQLQKRLGETAKSPRWVIAYKYQPQTAVTAVLSIDAQVGRTGVITPVARLKPVLLSGSTIKNATLHNYDEIARLGIHVGDSVEIEKSGEIIPKVLRVVSRNGGKEPPSFKPPATCPSCDSNLVRMEGEVALRCINTSCSAQIFASLNHFVSREAMNIEGLGPALIEQLINKKLVSDAADIFTLTAPTLETLERMGAKSAANIINAVDKSRRNPLHRLISGLGIRMIGSQAAKILAASISDISDLEKMTPEQLQTLESIGPNMAASITMYFQQEKNRELINRLRAAGVNCTGNMQDQKPGAQKPLSGKTFVLTGTLESLTREKAAEYIELLGGKASSSVSAKTYAVIAGKEAGSKLTKAGKLGVKVMSEEELLRILIEYKIEI